MKRLLCILSVIILSFSFITACSKADNSVTEKSVIEKESTQELSNRTINGKLSSFNAVTLDGSSFTPESFSDYDLTVINFWGTYCPPCLAEMPDLAVFKESLDENVNFITYCVDGERNKDEAKNIIDDADFDAVVLINADGDFADILPQIQYIPTTLFVDSEGNIIGSEIIGGVSSVEQTFGEHVEAALAELGENK